MADQIVDFLMLPVPIWGLILVALVSGAICLAISRRISLMNMRLNRHAESIANMYDWADVVEIEIADLRKALKQGQDTPKRTFLTNYASTARRHRS